MYRMTYDIQIGGYQLKMVDKVVVRRSVEQLSDTAEITLPASVFNQALQVESKIKRGDKVLIRLGYDDNNAEEFSGYLNAIRTDGGRLTLECEDALYLYRIAMDDAEYKNINVKTLLQKCNDTVLLRQGVKLNIDCDYDFTYDKFVVNNATCYDVLKKVQEEANPDIYLKGNTLHVHPQYSKIFGSVVYDFSRNIEKEDLKYLSEEDRKIEIIVKGKDSEGKNFQLEVGSTGGDKITLDMSSSGISDKASLKRLAEEELLKYTYSGYEGSITGWLIPYCDAGYKVEIIDSEYEHKNGIYYVTSVDVEFSRSGGVRKVSLGKRL